MVSFDTIPGRTALINGKEYRFFSGYSYLGMQHVPEFQQLIYEGSRRYGWLFPSSRISNTQLDIFGEMEMLLSSITGMEETVCFSSGFMAGRAAASLFQAARINAAPGTHPAITDQPFPGSWKEWLQTVIFSDVIAFDAVNPLTATISATDFLEQLSNLCIVDDSHGAGLINDGRGVSAMLNEEVRSQVVLTYSLSKAFHLGGGAVSCTKAVANALRNTSWYTASTGLSPAQAYAFVKGQPLYAQQRAALQQNISHFRELTEDRFAGHAELPIFILPDDTDVEQLQENGFVISSFAYPKPGGKKINRIVLNALHTKEDLEALAAVLVRLH